METIETSQTAEPMVEPKPTNWPKIILVAVLGLGLLAGAASAGGKDPLYANRSRVE